MTRGNRLDKTVRTDEDRETFEETLEETLEKVVGSANIV